jgi:hypothetical protein
MYKNSIYNTLRDLAGINPRKMGIAYLYSVLKEQRTPASRDPLVDEGQRVYVALDNIGRNTLEHFEGKYIERIKEALVENSYTPAAGSVREAITAMSKQYPNIAQEVINGEAKAYPYLEDLISKVGETLKEVLENKPSFGEDITAGKIQRYEQRAILELLSRYK